jgi:hypothetical protein
MAPDRFLGHTGYTDALYGAVHSHSRDKAVWL